MLVDHIIGGFVPQGLEIIDQFSLLSKILSFLRSNSSQEKPEKESLRLL